MPDPILPQPASTKWAVSGAPGYESSGVPFASGNVSSNSLADTDGFGALSGPWSIEEQELSVRYTRVPFTYNRSQIAMEHVGLSGVIPTQPTSALVGSTRLALNVVASVSKRKSYDFYPTSGYWQPQKFEIVPASADINGNTYGTVNTGCLGPAGEIVTSQKFFTRRPWDSGIDSEFTQNCTAWNFHAVVSGNEYSSVIGVAQDSFQDNLVAWSLVNGWGGYMPEGNVGPNAWSFAAPSLAGWFPGTLNGGYTTTADTSATVFALLDQLGNQVRAPDRYSLYHHELCGTTPGPSWYDNWNVHGSISYNTSYFAPVYDKSRHDYS